MLVCAFALSLAAIVAATTTLVAFALYLYSDRYAPLDMSASFGGWALEHLALLGAVAVVTLGLMLLASAYRAASLAGGTPGTPPSSTPLPPLAICSAHAPNWIESLPAMRDIGASNGTIHVINKVLLPPAK